MRLAIYGCGFAGLVSALGLCENDHSVIGIDISKEKVNQLNRGHLESKDSELQFLLKKHNGKKLNFQSVQANIEKIEAAIVTVPTPFINNNLTLEKIFSCVESILEKSSFLEKPLIIIRSTLPILGLSKIENFIETHFNLKPDIDYQLYYVPEFMREGTGLDDWRDPPLLTIGLNKSSLNTKIFDIFLRDDFKVSPSPEAESVKLLCNAFHATKITFANEAMRICDQYNISATNVMYTLCQDKKLNISELYLKPGFPWGGSCLGKDSQALSALDTSLPLIESLKPSNKDHLDFYKNIILSNKPQVLGFIGLSFKPDVVDTRDSPLIELINEMEKEISISKINILENNTQLSCPNLKTSQKVFFSADIKQIINSDFILVRKGMIEKFDLSEQLNNNNNNFIVV